MFEDTKGVIRRCTSKDKSTTNDARNTTKKTWDIFYDNYDS